LSVATLRDACCAIDPEPIAELVAIDAERVVDRWPMIARGRVR
jgi:hypothetical protein